MRKAICSRRDFLRDATMFSGALALGASQRSAFCGDAQPVKRWNLNLGIIGLGRRGVFLARRLALVAEVVALCDVHCDRLAEAAQLPGLESAQAFTDHRDLLVMGELDGVVIATPDHWHALLTLEALAAGKHVYLETPACRNLAECRALHQAAERYGRMIQVGNLGRANAAVAAVARAVRAGRLGKMNSFQCWSNPAPIPAPEEPTASPPELDWNRWLGPALERPYRSDLFAGGWRWELDLGGGHYRKRLSTHLALLPWIADLKLDSHWSVRPVGELTDKGMGELRGLIFNRQGGGGSILWQTQRRSGIPSVGEWM